MGNGLTFKEIPKNKQRNTGNSNKAGEKEREVDRLSQLI